MQRALQLYELATENLPDNYQSFLGLVLSPSFERSETILDGVQQELDKINRKVVDMQQEFTEDLKKVFTPQKQKLVMDVVHENDESISSPSQEKKQKEVKEDPSEETDDDDENKTGNDEEETDDKKEGEGTQQSKEYGRSYGMSISFVYICVRVFYVLIYVGMYIFRFIRKTKTETTYKFLFFFHIVVHLCTNF